MKMLDEKEELTSSSSIFSLTLDEIQTKSGMRSFGSMNMEDFIASIWSVEEDDNDHHHHHHQITPVARQGSFSIPIPIPIPLCKKTVDEIWFQIHGDGGDHDGRNRDSGPRREQTLGEMTLEDFLVRAGVVNETTRMGMKRQEVEEGGKKTTPYERESGVSETMMSQSQSLTENNNNKSGKRRMIGGGSVEVVVERRQRRMIKNRESAARSRARKQAYTVELEVELNQLKEENEKLKQNLAESDLKRQREVLMKRKQSIKSSQKLREKLRTIRRAVSLAW